MHRYIHCRNTYVEGSDGVPWWCVMDVCLEMRGVCVGRHNEPGSRLCGKAIGNVFGVSIVNSCNFILYLMVRCDFDVILTTHKLTCHRGRLQLFESPNSWSDLLAMVVIMERCR